MSTNLSLVFKEPQKDSLQSFNEFNFLDMQDLFDVKIFNAQSEFPELSYSIYGGDQNQEDITSVELQNENSHKPQKKVYKSSYTKNACHNICQKAIKVIKKGVFQQKLQQICGENKIQSKKFKQQLLKNKKQFTGPKALLSYIEKKTSETKTFSAFLKWFLTQKYLRMAINEGEMKSLSVYIQYKNSEILPLLQ